MNTTNLTARQRKFTDEYLLTGNTKQSSITAEYSETTSEVQGSRLLRNDKVNFYINECANQNSDDKIVSAQEIMEFLTNVMCGEQKDINILKELYFKRYLKYNIIGLVNNNLVT